MRNNQIGAIFIVSALALAGIGVSYAGFTDILTVHGTVQTATVEFEDLSYSGTWIYKVFGGTAPPTDEMYVDYDGLTMTELETMFPGSTIQLISSATAQDDTSDFDTIFNFQNMIACTQYKIDIKAGIGTIPVKVIGLTLTPLNGANWILPLIETDEIHYELWILRDGVRTQIFVGGQVHPGDILEIDVWVHIPQNNAYQGQSGSIQVTVDIQQWNDECNPPVGPKEITLPDYDISAVFYHYGPTSYWQTVLSGIVGTYTIQNGPYVGWCVDESTYIVPGYSYNVRLFSSYDLTFLAAHPEWNGNYWYSWACVNYLINHKNPIATIDEIQSAIWYFINNGYTGSDSVVWGMINDALSNGQFFVPQTGDNMAVLVVGWPYGEYQNGYDVQKTFIEVDP